MKSISVVAILFLISSCSTPLVFGGKVKSDYIHHPFGVQCAYVEGWGFERFTKKDINCVCVTPPIEGAKLTGKAIVLSIDDLCKGHIPDVKSGEDLYKL